MGLKNKILRLCFHLRETDILKTIFINLRLFPFKQAIRFPIFFAKRVEVIGLRRGCIQLTKTIRGGVKIGYLQYPVKSGKQQYTLLRFNPKAKLSLGGEDICIYRGCSLLLPYTESKMSIGNNIIINQNAMLYSAKSVYIGNNCRIGWDSQVYDSNFHYIYDENTRTIRDMKKYVHIGDNTWIGNHCTIGPGSRIPGYSIVAANSFVNKDFSNVYSKGNLFAGTPAKFLKSGLFRIFDEETENKLKWHFAHNNNIYTCSDDFDIYKHQGK